MRMRRTWFLAAACAACLVALAPAVRGAAAGARAASVTSGPMQVIRSTLPTARAAVGLRPPFARLHLLLGGVRTGGP